MNLFGLILMVFNNFLLLNDWLFMCLLFNHYTLRLFWHLFLNFTMYLFCNDLLLLMFCFLVLFFWNFNMIFILSRFLSLYLCHFLFHFLILVYFMCHLISIKVLLMLLLLNYAFWDIVLHDWLRGSQHFILRFLLNLSLFFCLLVIFLFALHDLGRVTGRCLGDGAFPLLHRFLGLFGFRFWHRLYGRVFIRRLGSRRFIGWLARGFLVRGGDYFCEAASFDALVEALLNWVVFLAFICWLSDRGLDAGWRIGVGRRGFLSNRGLGLWLICDCWLRG